MNTLLFSFAELNMTWVIVMMAAWFLQMGLHEGGHAIIATRLGDPLPRAMGRYTVNPFRHIEWNNLWSVVGGVIMPLLFVLQRNLPFGFAWVMVTPGDPKHNAKVAFAGPMGSLIAAAIGAACMIGFAPLYQSYPVLLFVFTAVTFVGILYGLFNLLCPLPGVDAGEILYYFLPHRGREIFNSLRPYSMMLFIGLVWILPLVSQGEISLFKYIHHAIDWLFEVILNLAHDIHGIDKGDFLKKVWSNQRK